MNSVSFPYVQASLFDSSMSTELPDSGPIEIEQIRNQSHRSADGAENGQRIMHPVSFIDGTAGDHNPTRYQVSGECHEAQSRS